MNPAKLVTITSDKEESDGGKGDASEKEESVSEEE